ncbi:hypothetical protein SGPA1_21717 [Streptomyces misionensis JCM 4497]
MPQTAPGRVTDDEYVTYRARPGDAVRDRHHHGRGARRPPLYARKPRRTSGRLRTRMGDGRVGSWHGCWSTVTTWSYA